MTECEVLKLALEALEKLWNIIDDIDTYGDIAKADEKLYRMLVERRQRTRFEETGISTDGYTLIGGAITAIKEALANVATNDTSQKRVDKTSEIVHDIRNRTLEEVAQEFDKMTALGDTAASFARFVRDMKNAKTKTTGTP